MEHLVAGPGARDGIRKRFRDTAGLAEAEIIRVMAEGADAEFDRLDLRFQRLWGRLRSSSTARTSSVRSASTPGSCTRMSQGCRIARASSRSTHHGAPQSRRYPPKWGLKTDSSPLDAKSGPVSKRRRSSLTSERGLKRDAVRPTFAALRLATICRVDR